MGSAVALGVCAAASSSAAQPSQGELDAARALGKEGVKLATSGQCVEAIEKLRPAANLFAAPTILLPLAECERKEGQLVEAVAHLKQLLAEPLEASAPPPFKAARDKAQQLLPELEPLVPRLSVTLTPSSAGAVVEIDGRRVDDLSQPLLLNPGAHRVAARAEGYRNASRSVELAEGDHEELELQLEEVRSQAPPPPPDDSNEKPRQAVPKQEESPLLAYALLGVGGLGLLTGSVLGVMALGKKSDLDDRCPSGACPSSAQSDLDSARGLALGSTIAFGVGVVGSALGGYLLFSSEAEEAPVQSQVHLGPGWVNVRGTF